MPGRRVVYFVATTLDGYVAAEDGSIDAFRLDPEFLGELFGRYPETCPGHLREPLGVDGPNRRFDTVIMGRATYEPALALGVLDPYPSLRTVVVSRTLDPPGPPIEVVGDDLPGLVDRLRADDGMDIWLAGGGKLAAAFRDLGLIDEVLVKLNPLTLGRGIPLFDGAAAAAPLELLEAEPLPGGVQLLRYRLPPR